MFLHPPTPPTPTFTLPLQVDNYSLLLCSNVWHVHGEWRWSLQMCLFWLNYIYKSHEINRNTFLKWISFVSYSGSNWTPDRWKRLDLVWSEFSSLCTHLILHCVKKHLILSSKLISTYLTKTWPLFTGSTTGITFSDHWFPNHWLDFLMTATSPLYR